MPLRQKFDFTTDYSNARPAERPRPFGGSKEDRAKRMSKAGKKIALGDQPNLWQTAARSDFVEYPAGTLASKAGPVDTSTSNMELTWEAPEGSDPYPLWETTMGSFAEKTRNASIEQEPANKPSTNNVNWKFGDEKRTWETAFKKDFPCHDPKLLKNPYENRPRGPKLATLNFGDDPNPGQYTNTYGADYVFDPAEVEKNRVEIAKPNRSSKLRFGDVQRTWETATRCDFIERPAEKFTKAAAAVDVKKSTVVIGEGKDEWITSYSVEIGAEQKGELAKKVPLKPLVTTVQIGDGVTALFQTAAKADYVDFSSQSSQFSPAKPRTGSCINLGDDDTVVWRTVDRDRLDPRTVPGAYIPTQRTGAAVRRKQGEKVPNRVLNPGKSDKSAYVTGYNEFYTRGNKDFVDSKRESSRPKKGGKVSFGDERVAYVTTYYDGQGKDKPPEHTPSQSEISGANFDTSKSSVKIGQDVPTPYGTTNDLPLYGEKSYHMEKAGAAVDIKKTSVNLGDDKLSYDTASKSDYLAFRFAGKPRSTYS